MEDLEPLWASWEPVKCALNLHASRQSSLPGRTGNGQAAGVPREICGLQVVLHMYMKLPQAQKCWWPFRGKPSSITAAYPPRMDREGNGRGVAARSCQFGWRGWLDRRLLGRACPRPDESHRHFVVSEPVPQAVAPCVATMAPLATRLVKIRHGSSPDTRSQAHVRGRVPDDPYRRVVGRGDDGVNGGSVRREMQGRCLRFHRHRREPRQRATDAGRRQRGAGRKVGFAHRAAMPCPWFRVLLLTATVCVPAACAMAPGRPSAAGTSQPGREDDPHRPPPARPGSRAF